MEGVYHRIYEEEQNKAEFVITPWFDDEQLTEHNQRNARLRAAIIKRSKEDYKRSQSQIKKSLRTTKAKLKKRAAREVANMSNEEVMSDGEKSKSEENASVGGKEGGEC